MQPSKIDNSQSDLFSCPPKPFRLMSGLLLLQHMHSLSDELVVQRWVENPYWQYFCGYDLLQWKMPIDPSSLTRFRNRIGACQKHHVPLRQNYNQVCKKINRRLGGYLHAKQMKRARKEIKLLKTILGRIVRDVERKTRSSNDNNLLKTKTRSTLFTSQMLFVSQKVNPVIVMNLAARFH